MPAPTPRVPGHPQLHLEELLVPWEGDLEGVCRALLEMGKGAWGGRAPGAGEVKAEQFGNSAIGCTLDWGSHWTLGQVGVPSETPLQALKLLLQHLGQGSGDETGKNIEQLQMHVEYLEGEAQIHPGSDPGSAQSWECADTAWSMPALVPPVHVWSWGVCACPQHPHSAGVCLQIGTRAVGAGDT